MSNKKIIIIFLFLIGLQALFSFLSPSYENNSYWRKLNDLGFDQRYSLGASDNALVKKIYPFIADYRLNLDAAGYLLIAHDFPSHYFKGNYTLLTRPVYPILVGWLAKPLQLINNSYSMTFVAGLLANFLLFFFTVFLFYRLVKKFVSARVAFLSSLLLIFSPLSHIYLIQPEGNIFGIFAIIAALSLLANYVAAPSLKKLVVFSLAIGFLLLGKKLFALSFFVLLLVFFFRRFKEGAVFFALHLLPLAFWWFWVTQVWSLPFYEDQVSRWGVGIWLLNIFSWPWHQTLKVFIDSLPQFVSSVFYSFLIIPVLFALLGYRKLCLARKDVLVFSFVISWLVLSFIMQVYFLRYGFWLFPLVYPLAVLGIDRVADFLRKYSKRLAGLFYVLAYGLTIFISSLNVYKFVNFG